MNKKRVKLTNLQTREVEVFESFAEAIEAKGWSRSVRTRFCNKAKNKPYSLKRGAVYRGYEMRYV